MAEEENKEEFINQPKSETWTDFLQEYPPGSIISVTDAYNEKVYYGNPSRQINTPDIQLYCPSETCNASMFFDAEEEGDRIYVGKLLTTFLTYRCRNCLKYSKIFSVAVFLNKDNECTAFKFGEFPPFGPPVPPRVLKLIGPDRELFLRGRRCENQGLGIGAFSYYRRVVENQWVRMVNEIIKVAIKIDTDKKKIDLLEMAKNESQFSKAVDSIKDAIPQVLLIKGHNPLKLLHKALSKGIHNLTDEQCLDFATDIRVVLENLSDNLGQALKDEKELNTAVGRLLGAKEEKNDNDKKSDE